MKKMERQIDENKLILETLERLKRNSDYQYLCERLNAIKWMIDNQIFNEWIEHEQKKWLIVRSNSIKLFIELPQDLIEEFTPIEEN